MARRNRLRLGQYLWNFQRTENRFQEMKNIIEEMGFATVIIGTTYLVFATIFIVVMYLSGNLWKPQVSVTKIRIISLKFSRNQRDENDYNVCKTRPSERNDQRLCQKFFWERYFRGRAMRAGCFFYKKSMSFHDKQRTICQCIQFHVLGGQLGYSQSHQWSSYS